MTARAGAYFWLVGSASLCAALTASCAPDPETIRADHYPDTGGDGFCRTTTCQPPAEYPTADGKCEPPAWSNSRECVQEKQVTNAPVWWRSACIGYDLNERASRHVSYEVFAGAVQGAFGAWATASCPSSGSQHSRASIDARDLGAVTCDVAEYNKNAPNQNVIVFHDDAWPYEQRDRDKTGLPKSPTIAQTIVTYDPDTGEIYDADIELNSADYDIRPLDNGTNDPNSFDLQAVLTHEVGHFLGLAHSPSEDAVMFSRGDSTAGGKKRALRLEDIRGICRIYPPDGTRSVSTLVDPSGSIPASACDPTPRHGFTRTCGSASAPK